jgi:hypothetical protein
MFTPPNNLGRSNITLLLLPIILCLNSLTQESPRSEGTQIVDIVYGPGMTAMELACKNTDQCKLIELDTSLGYVNQVAQSETFHLRDTYNAPIVWISENTILAENAIYSLPSFSVRQLLPSSTRIVSASRAAIVMDGEEGKRCVQKLDANQTLTGPCLNMDGAKVLAESTMLKIVLKDDQIVIYKNSSGERISSIRAQVVGASSSTRLSVTAKIIAPDLLFITGVGKAMLVQSNGRVQMVFKKFVRGYDSAEFDANGDRMLLISPKRQVSEGEKAKDILGSVSTLGLGTADERPTDVSLRVFDVSTGGECYSWSAPFRPGARVVGDLAPNGRELLFAADHQLQLIVLPEKCTGPGH